MYIYNHKTSQQNTLKTHRDIGKSVTHFTGPASWSDELDYSGIIRYVQTNVQQWLYCHAMKRARLVDVYSVAM